MINVERSPFSFCDRASEKQDNKLERRQRRQYNFSIFPSSLLSSRFMPLRISSSLLRPITTPVSLASRSFMSSSRRGSFPPQFFFSSPSFLDAAAACAPPRASWTVQQHRGVRSGRDSAAGSISRIESLILFLPSLQLSLVSKSPIPSWRCKVSSRQLHVVTKKMHY